MKQKCIEKTDFYDSEFKRFESSEDKVWALIQLWKEDFILIEYYGVKFFSFHSYGLNSFPYIYNDREQIQKLTGMEDDMSQVKLFVLEDDDDLPFFKVICKGFNCHKFK